MMQTVRRIAMLGNYLPRRCGIATFTHDLHQAIAASAPDVDTLVVAMSGSGDTYDYPDVVRFEVCSDNIKDYARAAADLNSSKIDVVSLQHEYGIFGGADGEYITELVAGLKMPVVTTLHTVLPVPSPGQRRVLTDLLGLSRKAVVMSEKGRQLLRSVYDIPDHKIEVIAHGIPDYPLRTSGAAKTRFGLSDRKVLLTFGLLSPNKGIEYMIDAMPEIVRHSPNALYLVLGATHPNLLRENGESYRDSLVARVNDLGLSEHVAFINEFVEQALLLEYISMCDVYVTPYLSEGQMTSGTLAYSFGLGKPVVSTPYWHAKELLADGKGILVPFADAERLGSEITQLLSDDRRLQSMRTRAYAESRSMIWSRTAERYLATLQASASTVPPPLAIPQVPRRLSVVPRSKLPIDHLLTLCDSTGISQHALHNVPDRAHGYCIDDNARALLLSVAISHAGEQPLAEALTNRFAAFVQHAWNPETGRFRNFMSYERKWLEPQGSEDSHGRALWALGECALNDSNAARREWARDLFRRSVGPTRRFTSPRAHAFALAGLNAYLWAEPNDTDLSAHRILLADRLLDAVERTAPQGQPGSLTWCWFEDVLAYDNARLPQALLQTAAATGVASYREAGLRTLRWLARTQTAPSGCFRPVGSKSFGREREHPLPFDQQPLEAWASISAYIAAWRIEGDAKWIAEAGRAFDWFSGRNDLKADLVDAATGGCCDGLHPDRKNLNQGAESCLSYLHSLVEMREMQRLTAVTGPRSVPKLVQQISVEAITANRGAYNASKRSPEPPNLTFAT